MGAKSSGKGGKGGKGGGNAPNPASIVNVPMSRACANELYLQLQGVLGFGPSPKGKKGKGKGKGGK